jgi:hypothetical protein
VSEGWAMTLAAQKFKKTENNCFSQLLHSRHHFAELTPTNIIEMWVILMVYFAVQALSISLPSQLFFVRGRVKKSKLIICFKPPKANDAPAHVHACAAAPAESSPPSAAEKAAFLTRLGACC